MAYREESDSIGKVLRTGRSLLRCADPGAGENFSISTLQFPSCFIQAIALIKKHAARVNSELGLLDAGLSKNIVTAAQEVQAGKFNDQFVVDVFQTGSGTSTNMKCQRGDRSAGPTSFSPENGEGKSPVHPNDHVNLGQSSDDVIPSAIHIAALTEIRNQLLPAFDLLYKELKGKSESFSDIRKIGRTHLQDAVPMTLGQEFGGYARQAELAIKRLRSVEERLWSWLWEGPLWAMASTPTPSSPPE